MLEGVIQQVPRWSLELWSISIISESRLKWELDISISPSSGDIWSVTLVGFRITFCKSLNKIKFCKLLLLFAFYKSSFRSPTITRLLWLSIAFSTHTLNSSQKQTGVLGDLYILHSIKYDLILISVHIESTDMCSYSGCCTDIKLVEIYTSSPPDGQCCQFSVEYRNLLM